MESDDILWITAIVFGVVISGFLAYGGFYKAAGIFFGLTIVSMFIWLLFFYTGTSLYVFGGSGNGSGGDEKPPTSTDPVVTKSYPTIKSIKIEKGAGAFKLYEMKLYDVDEQYIRMGSDPDKYSIEVDGAAATKMNNANAYKGFDENDTSGSAFVSSGAATQSWNLQLTTPTILSKIEIIGSDLIGASVTVTNSTDQIQSKKSIDAMEEGTRFVIPLSMTTATQGDLVTGTTGWTFGGFLAGSKVEGGQVTLIPTRVLDSVLRYSGQQLVEPLKVNVRYKLQIDVSAVGSASNVVFVTPLLCAHGMPCRMSLDAQKIVPGAADAADGTVLTWDFVFGASDLYTSAETIDCRNKGKCDKIDIKFDYCGAISSPIIVRHVSLIKVNGDALEADKSGAVARAPTGPSCGNVGIMKQNWYRGDYKLANFTKMANTNTMTMNESDQVIVIVCNEDELKLRLPAFEGRKISPTGKYTAIFKMDATIPVTAYVYNWAVNGDNSNRMLQGPVAVTSTSTFYTIALDMNKYKSVDPQYLAIMIRRSDTTKPSTVRISKFEFREM